MLEKGGVFGEGVVDKDRIINAATIGDHNYLTYCIAAMPRYIIFIYININ